MVSDKNAIKDIADRSFGDGRQWSMPSEEASDTLTAEEKIIRQMQVDIRDAWDYWRETYDQGREDVKFLYDSQWTEETLSERGEGRPSLTLNMLPQFVDRIVGMMRSTKISIDIKQKSGYSPMTSGRSEAEHQLSSSEIMGGIVRDIEARSRAPTLYTRAAQHAIESGWGWLRVTTQKSPDNPFGTEVRIRHVRDRWSVMIDPYAEELDLSDARWGIVMHLMSKEEAIARWPDNYDQSTGATFTGNDNVGGFEGANPWKSFEGEGKVLVAEYFWKEPIVRTSVRLTKDAQEIVAWKDDIEHILDELTDVEDGGFEITDEQEVDTWQVKFATVNQSHILDETQVWPGSRIPLVPVLGRQVDMDGQTFYVSLLRYAKDAQRMLNYWASAATERVGKSPGAQWIASDEMIRGREEEWSNQNILNRNVLTYNQTEVPGEKPLRADPTTVPTGELMLVQLGQQMVHESVGIYEAGLGKKSNEVSGAAINERREQSELGAFEFPDNMMTSVASIGQICCEIVPYVYDNNQTVRLIAEDGSEKMADINQEIVDQDTGKKFTLNSLDLARFECQASVGPTFINQKQQFLSMITELGKTNPQAWSVVLDLLVENMDIPFKGELARRFKQTIVPRQALKPEEQEKIPPPEPTPEQQAEMAQAQADGVKAQSDLQIAQLKVQEEQLKLEQERLKLEAAKIEMAISMTEQDSEEGDSADMKEEIQKAAEAAAKQAVAELAAAES